ncbi:hypothetical protein MIND_00670000 [Mycena indigotica]|uniref:Uncharacterized protein n=1 Tax=Mycena indigotica TaxID=2126181 RepID=A0A8H6SLX7_9AGAR|nr:uncharacterized protein MIND_00670000 [Mycena indigotica]KAF7301061.1 hypothetical protein MIND_00670000 [Mycena indigotica]
MASGQEHDAKFAAILERSYRQTAEFEQPIVKPSWTFPLPFVAFGTSEESSRGETCWGPPPRTLAELRMYALSWAIRSKPDWRRKAKDATIMEKWREEATEQQITLPKYEKLTKNMINFTLTELAAYSELANNPLGLEAGPFDAIWYSDKLITDDLAQLLRTEVAKLEDIPDSEKDWHPGSHDQVLDLVHPSLYPIMYGRTIASTTNTTVAVPYEKSWKIWLSDDINAHCLSEKYSWLPSDFAISSNKPDGVAEARLVSPYINNLHPTTHQQLYCVIEQAIGAFVPLFERVLSQINGSEQDLLREWQKDEVPGGSGRIKVKYGFGTFIGFDRKYVGLRVPCIWASGMRDRGEFETNDQYLDAIEILPEAHEEDNGALKRTFVPYSLRGKTIQCIVKLANIHLTPENKEYAGGSWHVEGMLNERIVASAIYYYDEDNITESRLEFRVTTSPPVYHEQDDELCSKVLYGMERETHCLQSLGSIETKSGRVLAWPNIYQHKVAPFSLKDPTRPGHRKILAVFLVDPSIKPVPSATTVPPQQSEWALRALLEAQQDPRSLVSRLPLELIQAISAELEQVEGGRYLGRREAHEVRTRLMAERKVFLKAREGTVALSFNMCEH